MGVKYVVQRPAYDVLRRVTTTGWDDVLETATEPDAWYEARKSPSLGDTYRVIHRETIETVLTPPKPKFKRYRLAFHGMDGKRPEWECLTASNVNSVSFDSRELAWAVLLEHAKEYSILEYKIIDTEEEDCACL